jgi:hypothetical protein
VFDDGAKAHGVSVILASSPGCIPVDGLEHDGVCARFNQRVEQGLKAQSVSDVVLVARWSLYLYGDAKGDLGHVLRTTDGRYDRADAERRLAEGLRARVAQLRAGGHRVWLVKEAPLQAFSPPYRLTRLAMLDRPVDDVGLDVEAHHNARCSSVSCLRNLRRRIRPCAWSIRRHGCAMTKACATPNSAAIRCTPMTTTCPKSVRGLWRRSSSRCL